MLQEEGPYCRLSLSVLRTGKGRTGDLRVECWSANNAGISSVESFRAEQAQPRKRERQEIQPFWRLLDREGDAQEVRERRKRVEKRAEEKEGGVGALRRMSDTEGLDEDLEELFLYKDDGTVEVHRCLDDVQWNAFRSNAKVCRDRELAKKICKLGRGKRLE